MTKRAVHGVHLPASAFALCLVLLQLVSALHFALIPHAFGAGSSGLVHLHRAFGAARAGGPQGRATEPPSDRPTLVSGIAPCAPDACPIGFSGPASTLVSACALSSLIWLPEVSELAASTRVVPDRVRALLSAPKTSPPLSG